jgi:hypothetical protein
MAAVEGVANFDRKQLLYQFGAVPLLLVSRLSSRKCS